MKVLPIISVLILVPLFTLSAGGKSEEPQEMQEPENAMVLENTMMMSATVEMEPDEGPFIPFKDSEQVMMLAEELPTVLFFNASWCPTCREARKDFTANSDLLTGVNLILVDYDNSDELQKKYAVTYQHTFVQIDENGKALATWNGGGTRELLANIVEEEM